MEDTLSYDYGRFGTENGWVSRYSFQPEMMVGLNSTFYSFDGGELFVHDSDQVNACTFYGEKFPSQITTQFNDAPLDKKRFKTVHIDSDQPWAADLITDLGAGEVEVGSYEKKEGDFFGYIRQLDSLVISEEDSKLTSTQGVGVVSTFVGQVITFTANIDPTAFAVGDRIFRVSGTAFNYVGNITAYTATTITVTGPTATPTPGQFIVAAKNRIAESTGLLGYYMQTTLTNLDNDSVELFAVSSSVFKSFP